MRTAMYYILDRELLDADKMFNTQHKAFLKAKEDIHSVVVKVMVEKAPKEFVEEVAA